MAPKAPAPLPRTARQAASPRASHSRQMPAPRNSPAHPGGRVQGPAIRVIPLRAAWLAEYMPRIAATPPWSAPSGRGTGPYLLWVGARTRVPPEPVLAADIMQTMSLEQPQQWVRVFAVSARSRLRHVGSRRQEVKRKSGSPAAPPGPALRFRHPAVFYCCSGDGRRDLRSAFGAIELETCNTESGLYQFEPDALAVLVALGLEINTHLRAQCT